MANELKRCKLVISNTTINSQDISESQKLCFNKNDEF